VNIENIQHLKTISSIGAMEVKMIRRCAKKVMMTTMFASGASSK
jgi:hypothetical protein